VQILLPEKYVGGLEPIRIRGQGSRALSLYPDRLTGRPEKQSETKKDSTFEAMNQASVKALLAQHIEAVQRRIEAACRRVGRPSAEVTLVAVTKTVEPEVAGLLPSLGIADLGESRPQELWRKAVALPATVKWHLVGHMQRNKIENQSVAAP
jgi:hypothetical protein